jgi:hypothetical protein
MQRVFLLLFCLLILGNIQAQIAKTQVVRVSAVANADGTVTLTWSPETYTGNFDIYKRMSQTIESWGNTPIATIAGNVNTWTDASVKAGDAYEYMVIKRKGSTNEALGYIYAGNKAPEQMNFGSMILLVDENYLIPLANEISTLKNDLTREGYKVIQLSAKRSDTVLSVRQKIVQAYMAEETKPSVLFLLGHIPVPYAGYYSATGTAPPPDGHVEGSGNHTGAWPADAYYGIIFDGFTDEWVNCTTGSQARHHNVPGDLKFDQTKLPSLADLEVGRVDLFNMPSSGKSDTVLMRNYLNRNHQWRVGEWKVVERALIDNNFTSLNLASTGYANFAAIIGSDSVFDNRDYFTAQKRGSYLWSYGCGAGSYTTCSGIGSTSNFMNDSFENVFTILAGSFFGDFDIQNNFLRAPLAQKSLASFWGGIPKWYVHHMALGDRIGKGTKISMNNTDFYFSGLFNGSSNSLHIALMGDPTLKLKNIAPAGKLTAMSENKVVKLFWEKSLDNSLGYAIYTVDTLKNEFSRINQTPLTDTFFVDNNNFYSGNYTYAVRTLKLEKTGGGTYYSAGGASFAKVNHVNGAIENEQKDLPIHVYPNPVKAGEFITIDTKKSQTGNAHLLLFDLCGREMGVATISNNMGTFKWSIPLVPSGIYFLKVKTEMGEHVQKIVVQ